MIASVQSRLELSDLVSLACQVLRKSSIEVLEWQCQKLTAGGSEISGGLGVYRVSGTARDQDGSYPWSLILKITSGNAQGSNEPAAWNYWKREVLLYQSGLLDDLPGSLTAPRCYAVKEFPGDEFWIWLEDMQETESDWTLAQHGLAARHLGEFNGAYLVGHPLPQAQPWLTRGRTREWVTFIQSIVEDNRQYAQAPLTRRWLSGDSFERLYEVWADHQRLLEAFERLPVCFCHHDAYRRNLFAHDNRDGSRATVAIDWAITGFGRVGEEIGMTTANNLLWMEVPSDKAKELDQSIFFGYVEGLEAVGWKGDVRLARLGYTVNAVLLTGLAWPMVHIAPMQNMTWVTQMEATMGHPIGEIMEAWATTQVFLLDLADEAFKLVDELK